jgi:hypothetical protein
MTCTDFVVTTNHDSDIEQVFQYQERFISSLLFFCNHSTTAIRHPPSTPHNHNHNNNSVYHTTIHSASILTSGIIPTSMYHHHYHHHHQELRNQISHMIQQHIRTATTGTTTSPNMIAALLFMEQQYVTILQHTATILHSSDLSLIPSFLQRQLQQSQPITEVWIPLCLPRLYSSGYVYCYATNIPIRSCSIDDDGSTTAAVEHKSHYRTATSTQINTLSSVTTTALSKDTTTTTFPNRVATLCLISTIGTTEEFQLLRTIAQLICQSIHHESISNEYDHGLHDATAMNQPKQSGRSGGLRINCVVFGCI